MSQAEEVIGRLASCLCEEDQVGLDELRGELAGRLIPLLADPLAGPGVTVQAAFEAAGEGFPSVCAWPSDAPRLAWAFGEEGVGSGVCAVLGWPHGRVLGDALCFECAMLAAAGVGEVCLATNTAAIAEGEFDEVMDPVLSVIRTAHGEGDECGCDEECGCECDDEGCTCGHGHDTQSDDACDPDSTCACGREHADQTYDDGHGPDEACVCGHDHGEGACGEDDDCCDAELAVSVALECGQLTAQQLCQACDVVSSAGPDYIVACTGAGPRYASPEDVRLICATVEPGVAVRATTDARTVGEALALFEAGAVELLCFHAAQVLVDFDRLAAELGL